MWSEAYPIGEITWSRSLATGMESWLDIALTFGLALVAVVQAIILWRQAAIADAMKKLEQERRAEEGAVVGWKRLGDHDTRGENSLMHGKIYQMAAWNQGARDQLIWNAEVRAMGGSKDGQYSVAFAPHGATKFEDRSWRIPAKSADRVQVFIEASVIDVADMEQGWMFLRFHTPDGPDYVVLNSPGGHMPRREEILRGWIPPLT